MKYEITVELIGETIENNRYPDKTEIYKQQVEDLDLVAVINAVNNQPQHVKD